MNSNILVIEDDEAINNALKIILELNHFKVLLAHTGVSGLELSMKENVDMILCDINLPDINGFEILKAVRESAIGGKIPFVFLTALSEEKDRIKALSYGADDYLTKPFTVKDLVDKVTFVLGQWSAKKGIAKNTIGAGIELIDGTYVS